MSALGDAGMSEEVVKQFAAQAAPVIRQLERNTGRAARSQAIAMAIYYSHRSTQRLLSAADRLGYIQRVGIKGGWTIPVTMLDIPRLNQMELPFIAAA
jgi:phosphoglycerate dehydrogenase-like enzyme